MLNSPYVPTAKMAKFGGLTCWAERGLVRIIDARPKNVNDSYRVLTVEVFLRRVKALIAIIKKIRSSRQDYKFMYDGLPAKKWLDFIDDAIEIARQATAQGEPSNAEARSDLAARRPTKVLVPGVSY